MTRLAGPIEPQRARTAGLLAEATAIAADHAFRAGATRHLPVVLLPANARPLVPMPRATRDAFLAHLGAVLGDAFTVAVRDNLLPMSAEDRASRVNAGDLPDAPEASALSPGMVAASCATCRGECCTVGGTHAFLRHDSMTRVRAKLAESGADSAPRIVARYTQYLPSQHYRGSCVYHAEMGCSLPRDMRSNLCNRYHCGELTVLERALDGVDRAAYVGAADGTNLWRVTRVQDEAGGGCAAEPVKVG